MRLTRLNEVQYAESEYAINKLIEEGFVADADAGSNENPLEKMKKADLIALATEKGLEFEAKATVAQLIELIQDAKEEE